MLGLVGLITASICAGCAEPQQPTGPRLGVPAPTVDQQISDGCARFQVRFDSGGRPIIEPIYASGFSSYCELNELKLLSDTAGSFDPVTGTLRVALVMENMGAAAVIPRVKLRFNADSVSRLDGQGNPVPGTPDILGYQPDSASANGRNAYWFFDQVLAPSGQPQVLMPGARTQRRWLEFRGNGWTDRVRLKLFATGGEAPSIPAVAPDSLPRKLLVEGRVFVPTHGFRYYQDILIVSFRLGTPLSERTRVLSSVTASVVGGFPNDVYEGGTYVILLPADSTQATLKQAEALLKSESSVHHVNRYYAVNLGLTYLRPSDGANWSPQSWRIRGDSLLAPNALRDSWGIQYIRAPMAWGCSTGDSTTHVGFVDNGFRTGVSDLPPAFVATRGANLPNDTLRHGTQVLSVVAAQGNNSSGITGLAWNTRFSIADPTATDSLGHPVTSLSGARLVRPADALQFIYVLASQGAQIINVSLGADSVTQTVNLADSAQMRQAREYVGQLSSMLRANGAAPPLLVVSGGNVPQGDPRASLFPFLKDSLPAHTLVVAAMARDSTLQNAPQGSAYIDLVAPGADIGVIDDRGPARASGASFATPIVTGIASLIRSFDTRLALDSVRALVIAGALRAGRRVGGYPVADAYESLRQAAEASGAPLCGNRVWADNGTLWAERSVNGATTNDEALATVPSNARSWPNVFHGGKRVQNLSGTGWNSFLWNTNGTWTAAANTFPDSGGGGTWWSSQALDHDLTKRLDAVVIETGSSSRVSIRLVPAPFSTATEIASIGPLPGGVDSSSSICILISDGQCGSFRYNSHEVLATTAMSPQGDRAFVAVAVWAFTLSISTFTPCPAAPTVQCAEFFETYALAGPSMIYEVNLSTGQVVQRWTVPRAVRYLAASERNDELVASEASFSEKALYQNDGHGSWVAISGTTLQNSCSIVFRDIQGPAVSGNIRRTLNVDPANACALNFSKGGGTIAPRVAPAWAGR